MKSINKYTPQENKENRIGCLCTFIYFLLLCLMIAALSVMEGYYKYVSLFFVSVIFTIVIFLTIIYNIKKHKVSDIIAGIFPLCVILFFSLNLYRDIPYVLNPCEVSLSNCVIDTREPKKLSKSSQTEYYLVGMSNNGDKYEFAVTRKRSYELRVDNLTISYLPNTDIIISFDT